MKESIKKSVEYLDWHFTCDDGTADKDAQKAWFELREQIANENTECHFKKQEAIKPTINEDGEAFCICGENVGIIPDNKNLPSICSKYCPECGRRMKWE